MKRRVELGAAETAVLRELVCASDTEATPKPSSVDWARLLDAAERHHLAPLLSEGLRKSSVAPPEEFQTRLANLRNLELAKAVVRLHHIDEIGGISFRTGIGAALLKGAAFATTLYRDPALRPMSDIDVLVARTDFESFCRALEELGYVLVDTSDHASGYRRRSSGVLVEVHRQLTSAAAFLGLDTGALLARSRPLDGAQGLRTLSWEDHLLHLSLHASFQHGFRQPGVNAWDARLLVERPDFDAETFIGRAREKRLVPWIYGGLAMTAAVFGTPRLTSILSALESHVPRSIARKALRLRAEQLLSSERDAVFGSPLARLGWTGWNLTTLSLLREISRPRASETRPGVAARFERVFQLIKNHGLAPLGSTSNAPPALAMGSTSASLGEVRDV